MTTPDLSEVERAQKLAPALPGSDAVSLLSRGVEIPLAGGEKTTWVAGAPMVAAGCIQGDNYYGGLPRVGGHMGFAYASPKVNFHFKQTRLRLGALLRERLQEECPVAWKRAAGVEMVLCAFRKTLRAVADGRLEGWKQRVREHPDALERFGWDAEGPPTGAPGKDFCHAWALAIRLYAAYVLFMPGLRVASKTCYLLQLWADTMLDLGYALTRSGQVFTGDTELQSSPFYMHWAPKRRKAVCAEGLPLITTFESNGTWFYKDFVIGDHFGRAIAALFMKAAHAKCAFRSLTSTIGTLFRAFTQSIGIVLDVVLVSLLGNYMAATFRPGWKARMYYRVMLMNIYQQPAVFIRKWVSNNERLMLFALKEYSFWLQSLSPSFVEVTSAFNSTPSYIRFVHALMDNIRQVYNNVPLFGMWPYQALDAIEQAERRVNQRWSGVERFIDQLRIASPDAAPEMMQRIRKNIGDHPMAVNILHGAEAALEAGFSLEDVATQLDGMLGDEVVGHDVQRAQERAVDINGRIIKLWQTIISEMIISRHKISLSTKSKRRKDVFPVVMGTQMTSFLLRQQEKIYRDRVIAHLCEKSEWFTEFMRRFRRLVAELEEHSIRESSRKLKLVQRDAAGYIRMKIQAYISVAEGCYDPNARKYKTSVPNIFGALVAEFGVYDALEVRIDLVDPATFPRRRYYLYPVNYTLPDPFLEPEVAEAIKLTAARAVERVVGGDGLVELSWLRRLGVSLDGMHHITDLYMGYEALDRADHHMRQTFAIMWEENQRDFVIIQRFFAAMRQYISRQIWHLPPATRAAQERALRHARGLMPWEASPKTLGCHWVCHCGAILAPIVSNDSLTNSTASGIGGHGHYSVLHDSVMCTRGFPICRRRPMLMSMLGIVYVKNGHAYALCTQTGAVVDLADQQSWGTLGPRCMRESVPAIAAPLTFQFSSLGLSSHPGVVELRKWQDKHRQVMGQAAVCRSSITNRPFDASMGWCGYVLDNKGRVRLAYLAPDETEKVASYLFHTALPEMKLVRSMWTRKVLGPMARMFKKSELEEGEMESDED